MNQLLRSFILFRKAPVSSCFGPPLLNTLIIGPDFISASFMLKYATIREFSKVLYTHMKSKAFLKLLAECLYFNKPGNTESYFQHTRVGND